jgi:hypothetical protein
MPEYTFSIRSGKVIATDTPSTLPDAAAAQEPWRYSQT